MLFEVALFPLGSATEGVFFLPLVILMFVMMVSAIYVCHLFHFTDVWEDIKSVQGKSRREFQLRVSGGAERAWGQVEKSCGWSDSYKETMRLGSKTLCNPARHGAVTGYQNQHSHLNVTHLRRKMCQSGKSAALKSLYCFQVPLNFISTQEYKYGLMPLLTN